MIITIDGPSGSGKSTVAKAIAKTLGLPHVDTGAIYRSLAWWLQEQDIADEEISSTLAGFTFRMEQGRFYVGETDVTEKIRQPEISKKASDISKLESVRSALLNEQRKWAKKSAVFDGRDMGSVVFPQADLKFFLYTDPIVRAKRRYVELKEKFPDQPHDLTQVYEEMMARDYQDSHRTLAPLTCPEDALIIDTTRLSLAQVEKIILKKYRKLMKKRISYRAREMTLFYRIVMFFCFFYFKALYRNRIYGLEHFFKGGAIIAPNHVSFYDPPLVASSWPEGVHTLARESLFRSRYFAALIRSLNAHPISGDAGDIGVFKKVQKLLQEGKKVVLFPEGSRSSNEELQEIKPGIALIMQRSQTAIIPVYLHGLDKIWPREHKFPKLYGRTACVFGSAIHYEEFAHMEKRAGMIEITRRLEKAFGDLRDWYQRGAQGIPP